MSSGCPEPAGPAQPHDAGVHSTAGLLGVSFKGCHTLPHTHMPRGVDLFDGDQTADHHVRMLLPACASCAWEPDAALMHQHDS